MAQREHAKLLIEAREKIAKGLAIARRARPGAGQRGPHGRSDRGCRVRDACQRGCGRAFSSMEAAERHEARCDRSPPKRRPAKTVSDLAHDRRYAERLDDDRADEARDALARGEE